MSKEILTLISLGSKILTTSLLLLGVLIFLVLVYIVRKRARYAHIPGPPLKSFLLGNVVDWFAEKENRHQLLIDWAIQYGPVYKFQAAHKVFLFCTTPDLARQLLTNSNQYPKSKEIYGVIGFAFGQRFLGNGIATELDMTKWRQRRKPVDPAFHKAYIGTQFNATLNEVADNLVLKLGQYVGGENVVKMGDLFKFVTTQAIAKVAFSFDIELLGSDSQEFIRSFSAAMEALTPFRQDPLYQYLPWNKKVVNDARKGAVYMRQVCLDQLNMRIEAMKANEKLPQDMLTMMVNGWLSQPMETRASVDEMLDDMVTFFLAGQETTSNTLAFMLLLLGQNPQVTRRLIEEVDEVVSNKVTVDAEDLSRLKWMDAVVKETLRIFPPGGLTVREVESGSELGGFKIPEKTSAIVSFFPIHRLHVPFGDQFLPERFFDPNHPCAPRPFSFLSFSSGQRSCLGRHFAMNEIKIVVAKLFQNYRLRLPHLDKIDVEERTTYLPVSDIPCYVYPRNC